MLVDKTDQHQQSHVDEDRIGRWHVFILDDHVVYEIEADEKWYTQRDVIFGLCKHFVVWFYDKYINHLTQ